MIVFKKRTQTKLAYYPQHIGGGVEKNIWGEELEKALGHILDCAVQN